jgi:hypothetical protein
MKTFEVKIIDLTKNNKTSTDSFLDRLAVKKEEIETKSANREKADELKKDTIGRITKLLTKRLSPQGFEIKVAIGGIWVQVKGLDYGVYGYLDTIEIENRTGYEVDGATITREPLFVVERNKEYTFKFSEMNIDELCKVLQDNAMKNTRATKKLIELNNI